MAVSQTARLVAAYDDTRWAKGHVVRIAPVVDPTSGTFRVTVALDSGGELRPGQFVSVRLEVDRHEGVLVIPKDAVVWEDGTPVVYRVVPAKEDETKDATESEKGGGWFSWLGSGDDDDDEKAAEATEDSGPKLAAARTPVTLGLVDDDHAEIATGLAEGETVITVGQSHLRDGARVRTAAATGTASAEADKDAG